MNIKQFFFTLFLALFLAFFLVIFAHLYPQAIQLTRNINQEICILKIISKVSYSIDDHNYEQKSCIYQAKAYLFIFSTNAKISSILKLSRWKKLILSFNLFSSQFHHSNSKRR